MLRFKKYNYWNRYIKENNCFNTNIPSLKQKIHKNKDKNKGVIVRFEQRQPTESNLRLSIKQRELCYCKYATFSSNSTTQSK